MPDKTLMLSDHQVYQRLIDASAMLGQAGAASTHGDTAIKAARKALVLIQMGLVKAMDDAADDAATEPADGPPLPPA